MSTKEPSEMLLLTQVALRPGALTSAVDRWARSADDAAEDVASLYRAEDDGALLEVRRIRGFAELDELLGSKSAWSTFAGSREYLATDVRRHVLGLVESVKPRRTAVPRARGLQLRHIEVPPATFDEYLAWRERTIFEHVRRRGDIDSFVAYHSILSAEPGVMFLSEFSGSQSDYLAGFASPDYRAIVEQAGRKYICGGERALHTTEWARVGAGAGT